MKHLYIPPLLIVYSLIIMVLFYFFVPQFNHINFPMNLVGLIIAFLGFLLMGRARDLFRKHKTTLMIDTSSQLITEGVFSKTRNPMYLGMFLLILGLSICSTNLLSLTLPIIFILLIRFIFIPKEEVLMQNVFGDKYLEYKRKVKRWL